MIRFLLLGMLYFLMGCFAILLLLVHKAPEYIEAENGALIPKPENGHHN